MRFSKPFIINIIIMVTGSGNGCFIKVWIRADGSSSHKTTSRMSENSHARGINIGIAISQLLYGILIVR